MEVVKELSFAKSLRTHDFNKIRSCCPQAWCDTKGYMLNAVRFFARAILCLFRKRRELLLENLVLRQQPMVLKRRRPRPALNLFDKFFWVGISRLWSRWKQAVIMVTPETVVRWTPGALLLTIDSVDCIIDTTGLPKTLSLR